MDAVKKIQTREVVEIELTTTDSSTQVYKSKHIIVGVYDTVEKAVDGANKALAQLSKRLTIRENDKFKYNGLLGLPTRLVTNITYPSNGVYFYATIRNLEFSDDIATLVDDFLRY